MSGSDVVDIVAELLPRWVVELAVAVFAIGMLVQPDMTIKPIYWYVNDKAQSIVHTIIETATPAPEPQSAIHKHRDGARRGNRAPPRRLDWN